MEIKKKNKVLLSKSLLIEAVFGSALTPCPKYHRGLISQPRLGLLLLPRHAQKWCTRAFVNVTTPSTLMENLMLLNEQKYISEKESFVQELNM